MSWFYLEDLETSACVSCGRGLNEGVLLRKIYSGTGTMLACDDCLRRYTDKELGAEADRLIALAVAHGQRKPLTKPCRHCGEEMPAGIPRMWCDKCEEFRKNIAIAHNSASLWRPDNNE